MPELPEVETLRRELVEQILDCRIDKVNIFKKNLRSEIPDNLVNLAVNQNIVDINRRSKYLLIKLSNNNNIVIHLGMSGRFTIHDVYTPKKHDHVTFELSGSRHLVFNDPRRFGLVTIVDDNYNDNNLFNKLGPEPLTDKFNVEYLYNKICKRGSNIKTLIMNNEIVVGVGNIYASESLYMAGILPTRIGTTISRDEIASLVRSIKLVLEKAINYGGSTLRDYVKTTGNKGGFQNEFSVYGLENKNCNQCSNKIKKIVISNRSTYYCNVCQK